VSAPTVDGLWSVSEALGIVPATIRRDSALGRVLDAWWATPRTYGCSHRSVATFVLLPEPGLVCPACAHAHAEAPVRCAGCGDVMSPARRRRGAAVLATDGPIGFCGAFCRTCESAGGSSWPAS
jgi:hypothetical protein